MPKRNRKPKTNPTGPQPKGGKQPVVGVRIIGGTFRGRRLHYAGDPRTRPMKDRLREAIFNLVGPAVKGSYAVDLFAGTGALGLEAISRGAAQATFIEQHRPTAEAIRQNAAQLGAQQQVEVVSGNVFIWWRMQEKGSGFGVQGAGVWVQGSEEGGERGRQGDREIRRRGEKANGENKNLPLSPSPRLPVPSPNPQSPIPNPQSPIPNPSAAAPWVVFCSPPYAFYVERHDEMLELISGLLRASPPRSIFVVEADERFDFQTLPEPAQWDVRSYPPAVVGIRHIP